MSDTLDISRLPGEQLITLGQGVASLGESLAGLGNDLAQRQNAEQSTLAKQQQDLLNAGVYSEYAQARIVFDDAMNQFEATLPNDPDYQKFGEKFADAWAKADDAARKVLTLPGAFEKYDAYSAEQRDTRQRRVYTQAQDRLAGQAEGSARSIIEQYVSVGDAEGAKNAAEDAFLHGILSEAEKDDLTNDASDSSAVSRARYTQAKNTILGMSSLDNALLAVGGLSLQNPAKPRKNLSEFTRAQEALAGLSESQRKTLKESVTATINIRNDAIQKQIAAQQQKVKDSFIDILTDPDKLSQMKGEDFEYYMNNVPLDYQGTVKSVYDKFQTDIKAKAETQHTLDQSSSFISMHVAMQTWTNDQNLPYEPSDLTAWVQNGTLREEDAKELLKDWDTAQTEDADGKRDPSRRGQTALSAQIESQMWTALGNGKDPTLTTSTDEINAKYAGGEINVAQRVHLLELYAQMKDKWADYLEKLSRTKGIDFDDPNKILEATRMIYDPKIDVDTKYKLLDPYLGHGIAPKTWKEMRAWINEYNGNETWKKYLAGVSDLYAEARRSATYPGDTEGNADRLKKLTYEEVQAQQALIAVFRKYPTEPAKWDDAFSTMMDDKALQLLFDSINQKFKANFGWQPDWLGGTSASMKLESAREFMPNEFAKIPNAVAKRSSNMAAIGQEEERIFQSNTVLKKAGVTLNSRFEDTDAGEWIMLGSDNNLYRIKSTRRSDGKIIQETQKALGKFLPDGSFQFENKDREQSWVVVK